MGSGVRTGILRKAIDLIENSVEERTRVAAMRVILAAGGLNIRQQALDLRREEAERQRRVAEAPDEDTEDFVLDLRTGPVDDANDPH